MTTLPPISCLGKPLDTSPEAFGLLRPSMDIIDDAIELRQRMAEDGYLYLPGYLDRDEVLSVRRAMTQRLADDGYLDPAYDVMESIARPGSDLAFKPDLALDNPVAHHLLYTGRMMAFYSRLLGGEVRHYDFTWVRAVAPGKSTPPHCDVVYMGRGTHQLYTSWTPIGDCGLEVGGLIVLEKSHRNPKLLANYCQKDVDAWCENRRDAAPTGLGEGGNIGRHGWLSKDPVSLRERLGVRWLTAEYRAGDLVVFTVQTVHASITNRSNQIRLSTDTRYQLASEPVDERWIGPKPIAHGPEAKRGIIC
jgi:ectoine hydroxylase-related dioxygenase (phytanoyl-CoA dioxygenase family)